MSDPTFVNAQWNKFMLTNPKETTPKELQAAFLKWLIKQVPDPAEQQAYRLREARRNAGRVSNWDGSCQYPQGCTSGQKAAEIDQRCNLHSIRVRPICKIKDCTMQVKAKGLCTMHGAFGSCTVEGCPSSAVSNTSLCAKHNTTPKGKCSHDGCAKGARDNGLCVAHGAYGRCTHPGCPEVAWNRTPFCQKHFNSADARGLFDWTMQ
jgi:hypothetical protein